jgi:hypothetical protein
MQQLLVFSGLSFSCVFQFIQSNIYSYKLISKIDHLLKMISTGSNNIPTKMEKMVLPPRNVG